MKKILVVSCLTSLTFAASAKVELATPFNDGMVLQRGCEVPVWGKAEPGSKVTVSFADGEVSTVACAGGCWKVMLPAMEASKESRTLTVVEGAAGWLWDSETDRVEITDVLVGEVWMCAGQSNTDCPIWGGSPRYRDGWGAQTLSMTDKPFVRLVKTAHKGATTPKRDYRATWVKMTPAMLCASKKGARMPSAMGYYYALELANALDIPIGLVDSSVGGTNIDAWTPPSGYERHPELADVAALPTLDEKAFAAARKDGAYSPKKKNMGVYSGWIQQPSALWNGMVAAYAPMACRGFIWYQGCHNAGEYPRYCSKMHALYDGWSKEFKNPNMKLYFVQLAPWGNAGIADIQMAQAKFAAEEPNAAMAVINDVGNLKDIHPNDKRTVARRLALHALKRDYGFSRICDDSPTLRSWKVENGAFVLTFNDAESFYIYNPDRSMDTGFEVAGADGVWKKAKVANVRVTTHYRTKKPVTNGEILEPRLVVSSDEVKQPTQLRYLRSAPWFGSLYSDRCLPVGAFEIK